MVHMTLAAHKFRHPTSEYTLLNSDMWESRKLYPVMLSVSVRARSGNIVKVYGDVSILSLLIFVLEC